jgi:hypothetical protein
VVSGFAARLQPALRLNSWMPMEDAQVANVQPIPEQEKLSMWDFFYALDMTIACLISYSIITCVLAPFVTTPDALLGGMWATVATVFVFRGTRVDSLFAGIGRLIATCISFALCLAYLLVLPFRPVGLAVLLGTRTVITMYLDRQDAIVRG